MASTIGQLNALADDAFFRLRCRNIILQQAAVVYNESGGTTGHAARAAFAVKLLQSPGFADQLVQVIVTRTNLVAGTVTYDFNSRAVITDVSDASILSQVASDWSMFSGV